MRKKRNCLFNATTLLIALLVNILLLQYLVYVNIPGPRAQFGQQQLTKLSNTQVMTMKGSVPTCVLPEDWLFPFCFQSFKWMKALWHTNKKCYVDTHGLEPNNDCSILAYLGEVESRCPVLPWRRKFLPQPIKSNKKVLLKMELDGALNLLNKDELKFAWMRTRVTKLWPQWIRGVKSLLRHKKTFRIRKDSKNVLVFLGSFAHQPKLFDLAFRGGPLGELVQWSDVITSLYILGHNVTVSSNKTEITRLLGVPSPPGDCAVKFKPSPFDLIYTDINGVLFLKMETGPNFSKFLCLLRVLDSFGTEAEFNYAEYKGKIPGGASPWGRMGFNNLRQIMTMFPHSSDNLFLGFVVDTAPKKTALKRKPIGLVYGKLEEYYKGKRSYLNTLNNFIELHGTVSRDWADGKSLPSYVKNHGVVGYSKLMELLREAKVFIGLGFPYEGPAPIEAIAQGCVFLNPKLNPPHDRLNTDFFKLKPTLRKLGSQHPYAEKFIGRPYVWTVDINNVTEVEKAIKAILKLDVSPYLPYEWTTAGMLERVDTYIKNLDFCEHNRRWPPLSERRLQFSGVAQSCAESCEESGYLCEPSFFYEINNVRALERSGIKCSTQQTTETLHAPSYNVHDQSCVLQAQPLLYSCVASNPLRIRLCPCRDFQPQQVAFCRNCG